MNEIRKGKLLLKCRWCFDNWKEISKKYLHVSHKKMTALSNHGGILREECVKYILFTSTICDARNIWIEFQWLNVYGCMVYANLHHVYRIRIRLWILNSLARTVCIPNTQDALQYRTMSLSTTIVACDLDNNSNFLIPFAHFK